MPNPARIGLEQARAELPRLVSLAQAGGSCVITRHGRPCAAIVPMQGLAANPRRPSLLALQGTGSGLWGPHPAQEVARLRDEWV